MDVNSLPKTVTRQRRDCDLNPGTSAPESSTLTTRLPSHPSYLGPTVISSVIHVCFSISHLTTLRLAYRALATSPGPAIGYWRQLSLSAARRPLIGKPAVGIDFNPPYPSHYPQKNL